MTSSNPKALWYNPATNKAEPKNCRNCRHDDDDEDYNSLCGPCGGFTHPTMWQAPVPDPTPVKKIHKNCQNCKFTQLPPMEGHCKGCWHHEFWVAPDQDPEPAEEEKPMEENICANCVHYKKHFSEYPCSKCKLSMGNQHWPSQLGQTVDFDHLEEPSLNFDQTKTLIKQITQNNEEKSDMSTYPEKEKEEKIPMWDDLKPKTALHGFEAKIAEIQKMKAQRKKERKEKLARIHSKFADLGKILRKIGSNILSVKYKWKGRWVSHSTEIEISQIGEVYYDYDHLNMVSDETLLKHGDKLYEAAFQKIREVIEQEYTDLKGSDLPPPHFCPQCGHDYKEKK